MPIYEYVCENNHHIERFFTTFEHAKEHEDESICYICAAKAKRVASVPLPAHFYGNPAGYDKPSPTKRFSTKLSMSTGNSGSAG